jgi:hypothetical protein
MAPLRIALYQRRAHLPVGPFFYRGARDPGGRRVHRVGLVGLRSRVKPYRVFGVMRSIAVCCLLFLAGCASQTATTSTPPAPPTPPQVTVANSVLALSHALGGVTDSAIACRQQTKCSAADVTAIENVVVILATTGKQLDAELASTDPWATQKAAILKIVTAAGLAQAKARVSPAAQLLIVSVVTLFDNISLAVGGPTI